MPYEVVKKGGEYCVVKKEGQEEIGCHPTRSKAFGQMRAIYAREGSATQGKESEEWLKALGAEAAQMEEEDKLSEDSARYDASLAKKWPTGGEHPQRAELSLDRMAAAARQAFNKQLGATIGIGDSYVKEVYFDHVIAEHEGRLWSYPYVLDAEGNYVFGQPSWVETEYIPKLKDLLTWVKEQFDGLRESLGLKHGVSADDHTNVVHSANASKCMACGKWVEPTNGGKCSACGAAMSEGKALDDVTMVYKDAGGAYRWLAAFTCKYRDRDTPPEIISDAAHREFVKAVNQGEWPMPEYRLWHIPHPIGRADFLAYHDAGFAVASGTIQKGLETVADLMVAAPFRWANSHGMPVEEIRRDDPSDRTVITRYRSKEITALPEWAAANEMTLNIWEKEGEVGFTDKDRERLALMFGDKAVQVEELLAKVGQQADAVGVESKEKSPEQPPITESSPESLPESPLTRKEVADAFLSLADAIRQMGEQLMALQSDLKKMQEKGVEQSAEALALTPAASLGELVRASIIKSKPEEAKVKGRPADMKGPTETSTDDNQPQRGVMTIPFLREMLTSKIKENEDE